MTSYQTKTAKIFANSFFCWHQIMCAIEYPFLFSHITAKQNAALFQFQFSVISTYIFMGSMQNLGRMRAVVSVSVYSFV